jgi:FtsP/CotA-like multicopper oxidase with cupredoxin domain
MRPLKPLTRRAFVAGAGLAASLVLVARRGRAESDGLRLLRATDRGYDGAMPGPILTVRRGEDVKVRLVNDTAAATAIHWHGVRVPNAMDGTALVQPPIAPGARFDYRFTPPDAGTFWYHPPTRTVQNRALHGLLIVYGTDPTYIDEDVAILLASADDKLTINGATTPDIPIWPQFRYRLRLANAADRVVALRLDDHPMTIVAIDGQPAEPFRARESRITLAPGSRVDVLVDAVLKPNSVAPLMVRTEAGEAPLARLVYGDGVVPPTATMPPGFAGRAITPLEANPLPARMDFRGALRVELDTSAGDDSVPSQPLFSAKRGRTVQLALRNSTDSVNVVHIHGHHVRLLDNLDDGWKPFWLDTIPCVPRQTTRVAFVADNPGKWLLSARTLDGKEAPVWFEVT